MTSQENHEETVNFFKEHSYFGGDQNQFEFFPQSMLPAIDLQGKILMHSPHEIKLAPNGNGALFDSIANRPNIKSLIESLDYVQVIGVDNPINKVLDPI